ncbi:Cysteine desulfurase [Lentibacillus sp. JNUCC-1]|uniref:aminotransferase class V-fold PLP-dependent enzyme n=1 Tax=Lentibacillus sp. JNUCC-1 TaxID=2654513 RepID=UPI001321CF73|nr:Cysteine desulfurase [Lentibacillus sp. JNUCC-1]
MINFDQAATSHPKPQAVIDAVVDAMHGLGGNAGRGVHRNAQATGEIMLKARRKAASLFGCSRADHVLFFANATTALNQALKGFDLQQNDHVIATAFEHNSVRRPLNHLARTKGIELSFLKWSGDNVSLLDKITQSIKPTTKLLVLTHASNVTGTVLPIEKAAHIAKKHGITVVVDTSQTAGHLPIHMTDTGIDMLIMPGHKGLMGPQGTGLLLVAEDIDLEPILHGGTGHHSETPEQPQVWPEKFESGTSNIPGIAGLYAALNAYEERQTEIVPRETILARKIRSALEQLSNVTVYGPEVEHMELPIIAFNIQGVDSQEVAMILDSHYDIAVRAGLHCSPLAHEVLNTLETGIVRASLGVYNTETETDTFIQALGDIAAAYKEQ